MARTNFHAEVYKEQSYQDLLLEVGCQYKTRGMLLVAWELAQKFWISHKAVPLEKWPTNLEPLLRHGFAKEETRENGRVIYVAGSADHCAFLEKQAKNGAKGGRSKSSKKLANLKQNQKNDENSEAKPKPNRSQKNPTEVSISNSGSNSVIPNTTYSGDSLPAIASKPGKNSVALWMEAYHRKYGVRYALYPKKDTGMLVNLEKNYSGQQLEVLFAAYLAMKDALFESQKHPLSLFFRDLPKISMAAQTGVDPSVGEEPEWKKQAREEERKKNATE